MFHPHTGFAFFAANVMLILLLSGSLVVIHNLHFVRFAFRPSKTHAELIVDANAVLTRSRALQCFQPVSGRRSQILQHLIIAHIRHFLARTWAMITHGSYIQNPA